MIWSDPVSGVVALGIQYVGFPSYNAGPDQAMILLAQFCDLEALLTQILCYASWSDKSSLSDGVSAILDYNAVCMIVACALTSQARYCDASIHHRHRLAIEQKKRSQWMKC